MKWFKKSDMCIAVLMIFTVFEIGFSMGALAYGFNHILGIVLGIFFTVWGLVVVYNISKYGLELFKKEDIKTKDN